MGLKLELEEVVAGAAAMVGRATVDDEDDPENERGNGCRTRVRLRDT
jgi:hypothetical protein